MNPLLQARIQAFLVQLSSLVLVAVFGVFLSPDFKNLVVEHFGDTFMTSSALLFITGLISHLRNKYVLGKLGSAREPSGKHSDIVLI